MGGRAEGLACADLGARSPIGTKGNFSPNNYSTHYLKTMYDRIKVGNYTNWFQLCRSWAVIRKKDENNYKLPH